MTPDHVPILVSYAYWDNVAPHLHKIDPARFDLIIDSGAFTAYSLGKEIKLDEYMRFLRSIDSTWRWRAIQLDVMGDEKKTERNLQTMLDAGFDNILPVFTRGHNIDRLDYLHSLPSDCVMFGGIVEGKGNLGYVKWFMERNGDRPVHWLGFGNTSFLQRYRPKSYDSSSFKSGEMYVRPSVYAGKMRHYRLGREHFAKRPSYKHVQDLQRMGFTMEEIRWLGREKTWTGCKLRTNQTADDPTGLISLITYVTYCLKALELKRRCGTDTYWAYVTTPETVFWALDWLRERSVDIY